MKTKFALPTLLLCLTLANGCGQVKDRADKTVVATDPTASQASQDPSKFAFNASQLKQFIDLYAGTGGTFTRQAILNILEKYKDQFGKLLEGTKLAPNELVDLLFKLDADKDGKISLGEVVGGIQQHLPILRWIPDNSTTIGEMELDAALLREYPDASPQARGILKVQLLRYSEAWAGGTGNDRLSRKDLASAGLILGMLGGTDFSSPIALPPGAPDEQRLAIEQIQNKLGQQLFGRYSPLTDSTKLSSADAQLEWSALALQFHLMDRLVDVSGTEGVIAIDDLGSALRTWGMEDKPHWKSLYVLYDQAFVGGGGKGRYASLQLFNLLTDVTFADHLWAHLDEDVSTASLLASSERPYILATLLTLYPRTGQALFLGDYDAWKKDPWAIRKEYWDGLKLFTSKRMGGSGKGKIDASELATALAYARLIENIYATYDLNHDGLLGKTEAAELFKTLHVTDSRLIDAFFADVGMDGDKLGLSAWEKLRMFFSGGLKTHPLTPYEFHVRLAKILPHVLAGELNPKPDKGRSGE